VYWADADEYYDVLGIEGEEKMEAIPAPVFAKAIGLGDENYLEAIRGFLGNWFRFALRTREEWNRLPE
jgi:hypothetical protein